MLHLRRVSSCHAALVALVAVFTFAPPVAHSAPDKSYVWADEDATVHTSTQLKDVPEPFLSIYRALASPVRYGPGAEAPESGTPEAQRTQWRIRRLALMEQLLQATRAWAKLKSQDDELAANPLISMTPVVQAHRKEGAKALEESKNKYLGARKALLVTFVNEARAAHVPAGWLQ